MVIKIEIVLRSTGNGDEDVILADGLLLQEPEGYRISLGGKPVDISPDQYIQILERSAGVGIRIKRD